MIIINHLKKQNDSNGSKHATKSRGDKSISKKYGSYFTNIRFSPTQTHIIVNLGVFTSLNLEICGSYAGCIVLKDRDGYYSIKNCNIYKIYYEDNRMCYEDAIPIDRDFCTCRQFLKILKYLNVIQDTSVFERKADKRLCQRIASVTQRLKDRISGAMIMHDLGSLFTGKKTFSEVMDAFIAFIKNHWMASLGAIFAAFLAGVFIAKAMTPKIPASAPVLYVNNRKFFSKKH